MHLRAEKLIFFVMSCIMVTLLPTDAQQIIIKADKYSVPKDGTVVLTCSMLNLKIPVTWNLNNVNQNLNIGYNGITCLKDPLPFPAPYTGDCVNSTVYSLTIDPVTSSMNGDTWGCLANDNSGTTVRSNNITIQVTVPITIVTMRTPTTSTVTINEGLSAKFVCTSSGLPAPSVRWYKDNHIPGNTGDDTEIESSISVGYQNNTGDKTVATTSTLSYSANKTDNGMAVYCTASNGGGDIVSTRKPILNIQFAPESNPVIQGFTSSAFYYMIRNSPMTQQLTCKLTGGNPLAELSWSCYGGSHTGSSQGKTVTRTVSWTAGTRANSTCTCTASHVVGWTRSTYVNVSVLYPPTAPQCSVGTSIFNSSTIQVIRGDTLTINCTSSGIPAPEFNWTIPNVGTRFGQQLTVNNVQTEVTYSLTVTNTMAPSLGQKEPGLSSTDISTEILFPPNSPTFHYGNTTGPKIAKKHITLVKGNYSTIACVSTANPRPSYTWEGTSQIWMFTANSSTSKECRVRNTMSPTGYGPVTNETSARLDVTVLYPPSTPVLRYRTCNGAMTSVQSPLKVIKGQPAKVECQSDSSPPPRYSWSAHQSSHSHEFVIDAVDIQNQGTYTCAVSNQMVTTFDGTILGMNSSTFAIDILYPPVVLPLDNKTVKEENTLSIECNVTPGNPIETTFQWTKNQKQVMSQQQLRIEKITRQQSGVYTCTASNTMRPSGCDLRIESDYRDVFIDVQYRSEVKDIHTETFEGQTVVTINQTSPFNIMCDVDGNPKSDITLIKDGVVMKEELHETSLYYTQPSSDCERDIGDYTCTGRNIHNMEPSSKNLTLYVLCKPRPSSSFSYDVNVTTSTGVRATLDFEVAAYPRPTASDYTWEKLDEGVWTKISNNSEVEYVVSNDGLQSNLSVFKVVENDFTSYRVNASNKLGTVSHVFHLQAQEKPHQPFGLRFESVKDSTYVILTWTPGFDGGLQQNFTIEYKKSSSFKWVPETVELGMFNHTLTHLEYGTQYEARIFAVNDIGASNYSTFITFVTPREKEIKTINTAAIIGGAVGGFSLAAMIVVAVAVVFVMRRKKAQSEGENLSLAANSAKTNKNEKQVADEGVDDDLPDEIENPMYEAGDTVSNFAVDSSCLYSQPQKLARQNNTQGTSDVYAVVQKKDKKKKQKLTTKPDKKNEDIYENSEKGAFDNESFNAAETTDASTKKTNQKHVNGDGLIYADIVFPNPPKGQKRFIIHGADDMTVYAELDPKKRADPLPDSDDERDQNKKE